MQHQNDADSLLSNKPSKKLDLKHRSAKTLIAALVLAVGITAAAPFFFSRTEQTPGGARVHRVITTHDLWMHLHTMEQFDKGLRSGIIYPRWVADINHGYGILTLIYYPPGFYYLTSAVNAVANDWIITLFVIAALALAGSGFALYLLARMFYGVLASGIAALLYIMLPIHMLDLYWRGGLPQFIGYIFPPLVIYFAYNLGRTGKPRHYAGLAVFYGLHLLTHIPVSLMFSYALAFFAVVWAIRERDWRIGARLAGAMALGLLLSAIYWLPAAVETKYAYEFASDLFPYHQSYVTLVPVTDANPYYDLWRLLNDLFAFNAAALIVTILVLRLISRSNTQTVGEATGQWSPLSMWITMGIATTFMSTSFSVYISRMLPKIQITVPAWRWLALAAMFTSLIVAAAIDALLRKQPAIPRRLLWACRAAVVVVIILNVWLSIRWSVIRPLTHPTYYPAANTASVVESSWTPKAATPPQELPDTQLVVTDPETATVEVSKWDPQEREIQVRVDKPTIVRLKTYNFPGWTARIDGKVVPMLSDKDGIQQVEVPPGVHTVSASFENTWPRTAGTAVSVLGAVVILGLALAGRFRTSEVRAKGDPTVSPALDLLDKEEPISTATLSIKRISRSTRITAMLLIALVGAIIVVMIIRQSDANKPEGSAVGSQSNPRTTPPAGGASRGTGDEAHLYLDGRDHVMVAVDEKASDEMVSAISVRDLAALDALIASGRVLNPNNNTRVRVLESVSGRTKVRILEGPHVMAEGWVPERWLR